LEKITVVYYQTEQMHKISVSLHLFPSLTRKNPMADIFTIQSVNGGLSRRIVDPELLRVCKEMEDHLSNRSAGILATDKFSYRVFPVMAQLDATTIIVAVTAGNATLFRALVLAKTVLAMPNRSEKQGQNSWTVPGMPGDVINEAFYTAIKAAVAEEFPAKPGVPQQIASLDATMLSANLNITDRGAMLQIADTAIKSGELALGNMIRQSEQAANASQAFTQYGLNIGMLPSGSTLYVEPRFTDDVCAAIDGTHARASWSLELYAKQPSVVGGQARQVKLATIAGYTDFKWDSSDGSIDPAKPGYSLDGKKLTNRFLADHVITFVDTGSMPSTETVLLAMALTPLIVSNRRWVTQFFTAHQNDPTLAKWRHLGGLGIEGLRDHNSGTFGPNIELSSNMALEASRLIDDLVGPQSVFSMAITRTGFDRVTYQGLNAALATGDNPKLQTSTWQILVNAANNLTLGQFGAKMGSHGLNNQINMAAQPGVNDYYVPVGTLSGPNGGYNTQDIDYLALANTAGEHHPDVLRQWTDTQNVGGYEWPASRRLATQLQIIQEVFGGNLRLSLVDVGRVVRLNANMMNCLSEAVRDALAAQGVRLEVPDDNRFSTISQGRANAGQAGYISGAVFAGVNNQPVGRAGPNNLGW
jgi:hypothetical protein